MMGNTILIRSAQVAGIGWMVAITLFMLYPAPSTNAVYSLLLFTIVLATLWVVVVLTQKAREQIICPGLHGQRLLHFVEECQQLATVIEIVELLRDEMKDILAEQDICIAIYNKQQQHFQHPPPSFERSLLVSLQRGEWRYAEDCWTMSVGEGLQEHYYLYCARADIKRPDAAAEQYFSLLAYHVQLLLHNRLLVHSHVDEWIHTHATSIHSPPPVAQMLFSISEAERKKLSHDIHDYLIQELIHMNRVIEHHRHENQDMQQLHEQMQRNIGYLRDRCFDLSPPFLQQLSLQESLRLLVDQYRSRNRCEIELICRVQREEKFSEVFNINVYRIAQELLNNAAKHAQAEYIVLSLVQKEDGMLLVYEDNGIGIDWDRVNQQQNHFGLTGIKERIKSMNGTHVIASTINEGLLFKCEFPRDSYTS